MAYLYLSFSLSYFNNRGNRWTHWLWCVRVKRQKIPSLSSPCLRWPACLSVHYLHYLSTCTLHWHTCTLPWCICMLPWYTCMLSCNTCMLPCHTCMLPCRTCMLLCHTWMLPGHTCMLPGHTCMLHCRTCMAWPARHASLCHSLIASSLIRCMIRESSQSQLTYKPIVA
jgi:hypothetical protein